MYFTQNFILDPKKDPKLQKSAQKENSHAEVDTKINLALKEL